jgi:hypothetical protein
MNFGMKDCSNACIPVPHSLGLILAAHCAELLRKKADIKPEHRAAGALADCRRHRAPSEPMRCTRNLSKEKG